MSDNIVIMNHPLIKHKISMIRNKETGTSEFRKLIEEIAMLMGYEALSDLPLKDVEIETPMEKCMSPVIAGKKLAVVPILRAGLGMTGGILAHGSYQLSQRYSTFGYLIQHEVKHYFHAGYA